MGRLFAFLGVLYLFTGCGSKSGPTEPDAKAPIGHIQIDPYFSQERRDAMATALNYLDSIKTWPQNNTMASLYGIPEVNSPTLHQWLEDRVQYILDESFDLNDRAKFIQSNWSYENPFELPGSEFMNHGLGDTDAQILGLNIGTQIYLSGKRNHDLYGLEISRIGRVPVTSPRTGIIQVGSGSFFKDPNNTFGKIFLMSVMFHEARHSDGRGKSAGFVHAVCPTRHRYAGLAACDANSNGPYTVAAEFMQAFAKNCPKCTAGQLEALADVRKDYLSRVLPSRSPTGISSPPPQWDDTPEGRR